MKINLIIIFLMIFSSWQNLSAQSNNSRDVKFVKITNNYQFPTVFKKLDSLLFEFYEWSDYEKYISQGRDWSKKEIPDKLFIPFAKALIWKKYLPETYEWKYNRLANQQSEEQNRKKNEDELKGLISDIIPLPKPSSICGMVQRRVYDRLPWEWKFHLENRYILIIEPMKFESKYIAPDELQDLKGSYFTCRVIDDLKGNYKGPDPVLLTVGYVKEFPQLGEICMIFIWGRNSGEKYHGEHYIVRGLSTEEEAVFPIRNGKIIDINQRLRMGVTEIPIEDFREKINQFIHKVAEVPYDYEK